MLIGITPTTDSLLISSYVYFLEKEDSKSKNYIYKISGLDYLFTIKHDKIESLLVLKKEDLASSVSGNVSTNIDKTENKAN